MTKITLYNHHCWCFHILNVAKFVAVFGLIAHIALFGIQVYRDQFVSVAAHGISVVCYSILIFGLCSNITKPFIPYFLFNPVALLVQVFVEIHAHYKWWWKRTRFQWKQREYLLDLSLLLLLIVLIILTHSLMVSVIYRAFQCLKDLRLGHHEIEVELAEAEEFNNLDEGFENNMSGECSEAGGSNFNGAIKFS